MVQDQKINHSTEKISVLNSLNDLRKNFNIFDLELDLIENGDDFIRKKGFKVKRKILMRAIDETRILSFFLD